MHINNCNTGKVEIAELHRIKKYKWQLRPFLEKLIALKCSAQKSE